MKNADKPINPIWMTQNGDDSYIPLKEGQKTGFEKLFTGLSKREYFAAMAMQGMWANPSSIEAMIKGSELIKESGKTTSELIALLAVSAADSLLTSLETK